MNEPTSADPKKCCPFCGALIVSADNKCWLCLSSLQRGPTENPYAAPVDAAPAKLVGSTLLLFITLAAVSMVLFVMAPGLGIFAAIFVAPAIIRTTVLLNRRARRGKPVGWFQRIAAFLGSLAVLIAMVTVATVGALGTFCLVVIGAMSVPQLNEELMFSVAALGGVAVAVGFILLFIKLTAE